MHMTKVFSLFAILAIALSLPAQATIRWYDGETATDVRVTVFTAKAVDYRAGSGTKTRPAHEVLEATSTKWLEAYEEVDASDPAAYLAQADAYLAGKKDLLAQYGYWQSALISGAQGDPDSMFATLNKLNEVMPNSGFAPKYFGMRCRFFLSKRDFKQALEVAAKYEETCITRSWSAGYEKEALLLTALVQYAAGEQRPAAVRATLAKLAEDESASGRFFSDQALIEVADLDRRDKKLEEAIAGYNALLARKGLEPNLTARALLGVAHLSYEKAKASKSADDYHAATKDFLMVYVLAQEANPEYVAEALYHGARTMEKWNGLPSCKSDAARLRGRLKLMSPYKETSWARK